MNKTPTRSIPEVFMSTKETASWVSKQVTAKRVRKIGPRLYTTNMIDDPRALIKRHVWEIVGMNCPDSLVADRTALESRPASDGTVFVIGNRSTVVELDGLRIVSRSGPGPTEYDRPFMGNLHLSCRGRAVLENITLSRARNGTSRTVSRSDLEAFLDREMSYGGEEAINRLRDQAREVSKLISMESEMKELDGLIGALIGSREDPGITAPAALARLDGLPYDTRRLEFFEMLRSELERLPPVSVPAPEMRGRGASNMAFFEAYFSNFIEGTEFDVDEAAGIVFDGVIPNERPDDAHDIMGTFQIVSDTQEMSRTPEDFENFISILKYRHAIIMSARKEKLPGEFKRKPNRAGSTEFVVPDLVKGTLKYGFDVYQTLSGPFARAAFMMFLVSEVHPFSDGNGRVARIMMNSEFVSVGQQRILIPIVYRNNYLQALKALSNGVSAEPLCAVLTFAQKYASQVAWGDYDETKSILTETHAFMDPVEADVAGLRLIMPS